MGLRVHIGQLWALIDGADPAIVRLVSESWLTRAEIDRGLLQFEALDLCEAGFFDAIKRIAKTHRKPGSSTKGACPKGQKMVFGVCRAIGAPNNKPPADFFAAVQRIATDGPDALDKPPKKVSPRKPRRGEDDSHMPPAWHRKQAERFAQQADFHKTQATLKWAGDPRSAAHHVMRSIEFDVRRQHHDNAAGLSPTDRQKARDANEPPRPRA